MAIYKIHCASAFQLSKREAATRIKTYLEGLFEKNLGSEWLNTIARIRTDYRFNDPDFDHDAVTPADAAAIRFIRDVSRHGMGKQKMNTNRLGKGEFHAIYHDPRLGAAVVEDEAKHGKGESSGSYDSGEPTTRKRTRKTRGASKAKAKGSIGPAAAVAVAAPGRVLAL